MSTKRSLPSNEDKAAVWQAYFDRWPTRVPLRLNTNPRIILMDPKLNVRGYTFEQAAHDPQVHVEVVLQWQRHHHTVLNRCTDWPTGLPDFWNVGMWMYNVNDAACLGAEVRYPPGQVPCTEPFLTDANKQAIFEVDIEHPLESPYVRDRLAFWRGMEAVCKDLRFEGRPVKLAPFALTGTDGPLTDACTLRGTEFLVDLVEDPDYADRLLEFLTRAAILRRQAFWDYWKMQPGNWMGDDSCALLSVPMYEQRVLPHHRRYLEAAPANLPRSVHMCGDATRLFPLLHERLGVGSFDTGFPVDHGALRRRLGEDVEICGGVEVALLLQGTPEQVYTRARDILGSGIKRGGRFIFQEGNNLPPCCPLENLQAMYQACLDHGGYEPKV